MLKQMIALIGLSAGIVLSMSYAQQGVQLLMNAHSYVTHLLMQLFSEGQAGNLARGLLALISIPFLIALVPTLIYWMLRRSFFPYFMEIVWAVWLVQVGALVISGG